jgi:molecular chaperone GrpE
MTVKKNKKEPSKIKKKDTKPSKKKEENTNLQEQLTIEKDKNLRLFAEFDNFRKRTAKERIELFGTASKDIMTSLLPILDNFERSFKVNIPKEDDGVLLIYNQLKTELEKKGLKEIENPIGKVLDTDYHEAITNIPTEKKEDKGKIVDIIEKGYLLSNKVLRYVKVVVAN